MGAAAGALIIVSVFTPLFAGAVGKVFLACMPEEQAAKIVKSKGLPRFTENSIVDPASYYRELKRVREKGYAIDDEEYIMGVRAVASPLMAWCSRRRISTATPERPH